MAFTKITETDLNSRGATTLPNQPQISAQALKQEFDAPAKQIVAPKFNNLIDELEATTAAASLGVVAPTGRTGDNIQAILNSISADISEAVADAHTHDNKTVLDKFSEDSSGKPTYDGSVISGAVESVNGKTGEVVLNASDVGALPDDTSIPSALADLTDDSTHRVVTDTEKTTWSGKSEVSVTQVQSSGTKIATVTVDGTDTDIYTPSGSGTGDMSAADYDPNGDVETAGGIPSYVSSAISGKANTADLATVATSGDYTDLTGKPNLAAVATSGAYSDLSGTPTLATVATSGSYTDLSNKPTIPDAQIQSDWNQSSTTAKDYIKNKPTIPAAQIQSDWDQSDNTKKDYIKNKPTIPSVTGKMDTDGGNASGLVGLACKLQQGTGTSATGSYAHTQGQYSSASGDYAHAEGKMTHANGDYSHAEGLETYSTGDYSHAEGWGTVAGYDYQTVVGKYNKNKATTVFEVGVGVDPAATVSDWQRNGFEVYTDGTFSQDDGTTKFKFTEYYGDDGYYDENSTFHKFSPLENFATGGAMGPTESSYYQYITKNGSDVRIHGTQYRQTTTKTTASNVDTFSFSDSSISSSSAIDVYCDVFGVTPKDVVVSSGSCDVKFDSADSVTKCRIYIR